MPEKSDASRPLAHSIDGACEEADCGRSYLYGQISAGRLRAKKMGRRTIILDEDLRDFLMRLPDYNEAAA